MQLRLTLQQRLLRVRREVDTTTAMTAWRDVPFAAPWHPFAPSQIYSYVAVCQRPGRSQTSTPSHLERVGRVVEDGVDVALHYARFHTQMNDG
jgi:hypothetical protein